MPRAETIYHYVHVYLLVKVSLAQMTKLVCLVSHIFLSVNVQVYTRASKKVSFQLLKNKGEITALCKTLTLSYTSDKGLEHVLCLF